MSNTKLNVLTLNCWGLKLPRPFCRLRKERLHAIGELLATGDYDLVLLQEVWVPSDYEELCRKLLDVLPHTHYFHSGVFGSGLCIFSRHSILETLQHRFSVNGSPFRIMHGDWYAQKSAGLVQIAVNGLRVNVYTTHTHADYAVAPAEYRVHRLVQAFELAQFVKLTSDGCDAVIVGGDLNMTPADVGYNLVVAAANLQDCWINQLAQQRADQKVSPKVRRHLLATFLWDHELTTQETKKESADRTEDIGATVDHPDNAFSGSGATGKRIDYLLYRNNSGCDVRCTSCFVTMKRVPGKDYDYSDHYAVAASLVLKKNVTAMAPEVKLSCVRELYKAAIPQLEDGVGACHNHRLHYALTALLCLLTFIFGECRVVVMLVLGLCMWCGIVVSNRQENSILSAKKDTENQLRAMG